MDFVSIVTTMCPEAKWTQTPQEDLKKAKTLKKVLGAALNSPRKKKKSSERIYKSVHLWIRLVVMAIKME